MALVWKTVTAAAAIAVAGCATAPAPMPADMDIEFAWGCWVQKEAPGGNVQAFLRLLPDNNRLSGQLTDVSDGGWNNAASFSFVRAGDSVTFSTTDISEQTHTRIDPSRLGASFDWARPQSGGKLAAYAGPAPARSFLFAEGGDDHLAIWAVNASSEATLVFKLFDGERDGCD